MPKASSLGVELKTIGAEVELIAGSGGIFEVIMDGREIYSKKKAGKFPEKGEVVALIAQQS